MTATLDARPHAEAIKAALKTALNSEHAYDYDEAPGSNDNPGTLPNIFVLVSVELLPSSSPRMAGRTTVRRWIATVRGVGRTVDEARWAMWRASVALHEQSLTVEDRTTTPLQFEPGDAPKPDDGRYSGLHTFTYAH